MKKRFLAMLLTIVLMFGVLPTNIYAADTQTVTEENKGEQSGSADLSLTSLEIGIGGTYGTEPTTTKVIDLSNGATEYTIDTIDYISSWSNRVAYVKAAASDEDAAITAKISNCSAALSANSWTKLLYAYATGYVYGSPLQAGAYNEMTITVTKGEESKEYKVIIPIEADIANQSLSWKTDLSDGKYCNKNAEISLSVEAKYNNRPLAMKDEITYQWYSNTSNSTENGKAIEGATSMSYKPSTAALGTNYYYVVASCNKLTTTSKIMEVTVTDKAAPTAVELVCDWQYTTENTWVKALGGANYVATIGDKLNIKAIDENGDETPVSWNLSLNGNEFDKDSGVYTIKNSSYGYITAVSLYDSSITSGEKAVQVLDYKMTSYNKAKTVQLSTDGQKSTTVSVTGGITGYTNWTYKVNPDSNVAECTTDLKKKDNSIGFNVFRPGTIEVSYTLDLGGEDDPKLTDNGTITITGVAVEDSVGKQGKTYVEVNGEGAAATEQLTAYVAEERTVASWSSADETIATVDGNGKVTALKAGSVIITATDSEGTTGGIKVVVEDANTPYFEHISFTRGSAWSPGLKTDITFSPTTTEYKGLTCTTYSTSYLTLTTNTLYNTEKYTAVAEYTDINGEKQSVSINSGAATKLDNIPFGTSTISIIITDKNDANKKTTYTFEVTRPRDTNKQIAYSGGISLGSDVRDLSTNKYNNKTEGQLFRTDTEGVWDGKTTYGVTYSYYNYRAWMQDGLANFKMTVKGYTNYVHMRYSTDDGTTWKDLAQGGGTTDTITFPERTGEENPVVKVLIQVLDDTTYTANVTAGKDGFAEATPNTYTVWVEQLPVVEANMLTAELDTGDFYPAFASDYYTYSVLVKNGAEAPTLTYTVTDETTVTIDGVEQTAVDGKYTLTLTKTAQEVVLSRKGGTRTYSFRYSEKASNNSPDKVIDYLPINSQYTNGGQYGMYPIATLTGGGLLSLGNFGGYITYYYENGLTDNPNNKYGVDFYIYGNAFKDTSTGTGLGSMEPGQVWVSEDGENWYALAGSEHYEDDTVWNYEVTYSKTEIGLTSWTDNYGNKDNGSQVGQWPLASNYPWNKLLENDTFTLGGILLPCVDGSLTGNGSFSSFSSGAKFGYVDVLMNSAEGEDANPYLENENYGKGSSGFDLAWAVDGNGDPVDVSGKEFHYVKVVTASNLWAGAANEKSTEIGTVLRTTAQAEAVGTSTVTGVSISGVGETKEVTFEDGKQIYEVNLGSMKYISINVNGTSEDANIYVNNQRVEAGEAATGIKVTAEDGVKTVRVIVQDGNKEPAIYLLKLTSEASAVNDLIEDMQIDVNGVTKSTKTSDGETFTASVAYRIEEIAINPIVSSDDVTITINGEEVQNSYAVKEGENTFTIEATKGEIKDTATVVITKEATPESTGEITVYFSLLGDEEHGQNGECHTLVEGNLDTWIPQTAYTMDTPAVVLDLFEIALAGKYEFVNSGNYISQIGDLAEFDNGPNSGWMYTINGVHSELGIAEQALESGDVIVFHYSDDYTTENYDEVVSVDYVEGLIDAIGTVTLESADKISAARAAYDKLSEEEKAEVENYETLTAAEDKLEELIKELKGTLEEIEDIYTTTGKYLVNNVTDPTVASIGGEWAVLGLARAGYEVPEEYYTTYVENLIAIMEENDGVLHDRKYTEYERVILALTSIGYDVTDVAGYNLLDYMADYDKVVWQGINSVAYALIALDSHEYEIPAAGEGKTQTTREKLIDALLAAQLGDNGWALSGTKADSDMTGIVLQALAPYYGKHVKVTAAVNKALITLSELQGDDGLYKEYKGVPTVESNAQVIVALTALGINPDTDSRFIKNGTSVLDALCTFYTEGGGFSHVLGGNLDGMATEQGYYALASYYRMLNDQTALYDMTDVVIENNGEELPGDADKPVEDEKPVEGNKPEDDKNSDKTPGTGDYTQIGFYVVLACAALLGSLVVVKRKRS